LSIEFCYEIVIAFGHHSNTPGHGSLFQKKSLLITQPVFSLFHLHADKLSGAFAIPNNVGHTQQVVWVLAEKLSGRVIDCTIILPPDFISCIIQVPDNGRGDPVGAAGGHASSHPWMLHGCIDLMMGVAMTFKAVMLIRATFLSGLMC
jgi:hypothetical protein